MMESMYDRDDSDCIEDESLLVKEYTDKRGNHVSLWDNSYDEDYSVHYEIKGRSNDRYFDNVEDAERFYKEMLDKIK